MNDKYKPVQLDGDTAVANTSDDTHRVYRTRGSSNVVVESASGELWAIPVETVQAVIEMASVAPREKVHEGSDLKPCPFCGDKAKLISLLGRNWWAVQCQGCGNATMPTSTSPDLSIERWNNRPRRRAEQEGKDVD